VPTLVLKISIRVFSKFTSITTTRVNKKISKLVRVDLERSGLTWVEIPLILASGYIF
jgi:hypothetical protein